jgi:RNA polymerase sigma-70 factor, ECF subfamily
MSRRDLAALVEAATAARPTLDRVAFTEHLDAVCPEEGELSIGDLALAFQAAHGDDRAVAELHALIERAARIALATAGYAPSVIEDTIQETSVRLLLSTPDDRRPILLTHQGRARLSAWVKTIALRTAARLVELEKRVQRNDGIIELLAGSHDPARDVLKSDLRPAVRAAFASAVRGLSYFHRELLASVIIDGETIDQMARRHKVHRATAARWIGRARAALDEGMRRELGTALRLSPSEVSSVLTAIATTIDFTVDRLLDGVPGGRG